ncbi:YicC/YloC family endoribonuclease [Peptostreptococcus canis]|uniref:YicC family protein n=1 Tax=Peptostreptococcus canis TaxID=1159213 RepID=A0ABR6TKW9_9FIRM|nr:YicC/YloC family endoribonuclease [Peptostreptococcus canis]MBC2575636.1 YicC family protein [Peptostreptococcus canis]MBP1997159.1 uncharacterized protein (TIGR00255 family) [Peptostreptococcus canis]
MAISMTGFGIGEYKNEDYSISIECKTINHKYLDINPRLPRKFLFLEDKLRLLIKDYLNRGRVDIFVKLETLNSTGTCLNYDRELATQYFSVLTKIKEDFDISQEIRIRDIARFPDVVTVSESEEDEEILWKMLAEATENCMKKLCEMRYIEGKKLETDILERSYLLEKNILEIEKLAYTVEIDYREKLQNRIADLLEDPGIVDEYRLAQEVAIFADKSSITEEIVRFKSHIVQLRNTIILDESIGRKMDFIIQEMNRETNTIGSKASNINITNLVIDIKSELEKIREQIQNVE